MKTTKILTLAAIAATAFMSSCKKNDSSSSAHVNVSQPVYQIGQAISDTTTGGSVKGTMLSGHTYHISRNMMVNAGDTLLLQSNVNVCIADMKNISITVRGVLLSLGTQSQPNWFTICGLTKQDFASEPVASDPAYTGHWYGINCDTTCKLCVLKWTHVEFPGQNVLIAPVSGVSAGAPSFAVFFGNNSGSFVFEDSWIYGTTDDAVHVAGGKLSIMRNTFEKQGYNSGESVNTKTGCVGDVAYNLFIGGAVNGIKHSNAGAGPIQGNVNCYNNTIIDNGFRNSTPAAHGASINYEKGGTGKVYNNLFVNCRLGFRLVNTADTTAPGNVAYGNNYYYGDSLSVVDQFYPAGNVIHPPTTDYPNPWGGLLPVNYSEGESYTAPASYVSANNPMFKNFPLPNYNYQLYTYASGYNFHLQAGSPAIGKGSMGFSAFAEIPVNTNFGPSQITQPGADAGCYQSNGTGNQH